MGERREGFGVRDQIKAPGTEQVGLIIVLLTFFLCVNMCVYVCVCSSEVSLDILFLRNCLPCIVFPPWFCLFRTVLFLCVCAHTHATCLCWHVKARGR